MPAYLGSLLFLAALGQAPDAPVPTFGTTVVIPAGLRGQIYYIRHNTTRLPRFEKMKPVGTIYTTALNVPSRAFSQGFPGVTERFEWFAIDYTGRFWIEKPGVYEFSLTSDDGARLLIDGRELIDDDGQHEPVTKQGRVNLTGGIHRMRVSYFQGPRYLVALILKVAGPDDVDLRVFSTDEFKPPPHPEDWKYGNAGELRGEQ
jgi:PA14 domain